MTLAPQTSSKAAPWEWIYTFSGVSIVFVLCVKIVYAFKTSWAFKVLLSIYFNSILNESRAKKSFAVAQFKFLNPLSAHTICKVFSIKGFGLEIAFSSKIFALDNSFKLKLISCVEF